MIIERTQKDLHNETIQLFQQIKPLLDKGESYHSACKLVRNTSTIGSTHAWYKRLLKYGESQGYPPAEYKRKKKTVCHYRQLMKLGEQQ